MADKNKNKRPSTMVRRTVPNTYWLNNAMKSIGMGLVDYAEKTIPNISYMSTTAATEAAEYIRNQKKDKSALEKIVADMKNSDVVQGAQEVFKNAITDLKSGKFSDNDREAGDMFGFDSLNEALDEFNDIDFSDFGDDEDDEGQTIQVNNDNRINVVNNSATKLAEPIVTTMQQVGKSQVQATAAISTELVEIGSKILFQSSRQSEATLEKLSSIDSRLAAINEFNNTTMSKFAEVSTAYYEAILKKKNEDEETESPDALYSDGKLNIKTYLGGMKDEFTKSVGKLGDGVAGLIMSMAPQIIEGIKQNPIGTLIETSLDELLPSITRASIKSLDKAFGEFVPAALVKMADWQYKGNNEIVGGILETLVHTLGRKDEVNKSLSIRGVKNEVVQWDKHSKHTLVDTIPKYLREISAYTRATAQAITGSSREQLDNQAEIFNFKKGTYETKKELKDSYFGALDNAATSGFNGSSFEKEVLGVMARIQDDKQRRDFDNIIQEMMIRLTVDDQRNYGATSIDTINQPAAVNAMVDSLNGNATSKEMLKATLASLSNEARLSVTKAQQDSVRAYNELLKDINENQESYKISDIYSDTTLNTDVVYDDMLKWRRGKQKTSPAKIEPKQNIKNSLGNTSIGIIGDIRSILLRGINVRIDRRSRKLYDLTIPPSIENLNGQPIPPSIQPQGSTSKKKKKKKGQQEAAEDRVQMSNEEIQAFVSESLSSSREDEFDDILKDTSSIFGDDLDNSQTFGARRRRTNEAVERYTTKGKDLMHAMIYGNANDLVNQIIADVTDKAMDMGTTVVKKFVTPVVDHVTKDDEETGRKSIATLVSDQVNDVVGETQHVLFGKGYTKSDGTKVEAATGEELDNTVAGGIKKTFKTVTDGIGEYIFGKDNPDGESDGKTSVIAKLKNETAAGFVEWRNMVFGTETENTPKARQEAIERVQRFTIKAIPNAALGALGSAGLGMIAGNSLLGAAAGGPVGAILGSGLAIAMSSDSFREKVFGKEDEETGDWIDGVIPKSTQTWFKENSKTIAGGAALGGLKSIVMGSSGGLLGSLVGGPLAGAVLGAGFAFVKKSEGFQKFLYGEDIKDDNGNVIRHVEGALGRLGFRGASPETMEKAKRMGLTGAVGGGVIGAIMLNPILGASLGLASGLLASNEKFQELMFGKKGPDGKRDRNTSIFGKIQNFLKVGVFNPISSSIRHFGQMVGHHLKYSILTPISIALQPLFSAIGRLGRNVKGLIHNVFVAITSPFRWIAKKIYNKLFKGKLAKAIGNLIRIPIGLGKRIFGLFSNMARGAQYILASGSAIGNTLGTVRNRVLGSLTSKDGITANTTNEDGTVKTGLGYVKGVGKGILQNVKTSFQYATNHDNMLTDAIIDENGALAGDTFRQIAENEKARKADFARIQEDHKWRKANDIYQAALSGALGYTIRPNKYGVIDMQEFDDKIRNRSTELADKHNRSLAGVLGHRDASYYEEQLRKSINKSSKGAFKLMGVDNLEDFNEKMMARIDPNSGKSIAEMMSNKDSDRQAKEYRDKVVSNLSDVNADTDSILEQLIQIRAHQMTQNGEGDPEAVAAGLRRQMNKIRNVFNKTKGDVNEKRAAVYAKFSATRDERDNTSRLNEEDETESQESVIPQVSFSNDVEDNPEGYAKGTKSAKKGVAVVGENGPELVNFKGGESVVPSNKIGKALKKSTNLDAQLMKMKPQQLSIQERILAAVLTIRSSILNQDPNKPFNYNTFRKIVKSGQTALSTAAAAGSGIAKVASGTADVAKKAVDGVGNAISGAADILTSPSKDGKDVTNFSEVVDLFSATEDIKSEQEKETSKEIAEEQEKENTKKENREKATAKSYQNMQARAKEEATKLAPIQMAQTLNQIQSDNQKQHSVWRSVFSKDGLIAGLLIPGIPLLLKLIKKILSFNLNDALESISGSIFKGLGTLIKATGTGVSSFLGSIFEQFTYNTEHAGTDAEGKSKDGQGLIEQLGNGVKNVFSTVGNSVGGLWDVAGGTVQNPLSLFNNTRRNEGINEFISASHDSEKTGDLAINSKTGAVMNLGVKVARSGQKKVAKIETKLAADVADNSILSKAISFVTSFIKKVGNAVLSKLGNGLMNIDIVSSTVHKCSELINKLAGTEAVQWLSTKLAWVSAKVGAMASSVVGLLANDTVFAVAGGLDRATATAKLFQVDKKYVSKHPLMVIISAALGTFLSTSIGMYIDVIASVVETALGMDLIGHAAVGIYNAVCAVNGNADDIAELDSAQEDWKGEYEDYASTSRSEQTDLYNKVHGTNYTVDEYLAGIEDGSISDGGTDIESFNDWNARENASVMTKVGNGAMTVLSDIINKEYSATYTNQNGETFTLVRNHEGTFDVYDANGEKQDSTLNNLPEGAIMNTTKDERYQNAAVQNSEFANKTYTSADGKKYYIFNGISFDEYSVSSNRRNHSYTVSVDQMIAKVNSGEVINEDIGSVSILNKYGNGRVWTNKNGDRFMLDDQYYISRGGERWIMFNKNGEVVRIIDPTDKANLANLHKAINDGELTQSNTGNLYNITRDSTAYEDSGLGAGAVGQTGVDYFSKYMDNLSSQSEIIGSAEELDYSETDTSVEPTKLLTANDAVIKKNKNANDALWSKYGGKDFYDDAGYRYRLDDDLRNKTGAISFAKYSSTGDFLKYITSTNKEFNTIIDGIESGLLNDKNPLDNITIMKTKKLEKNIKNMTSSELEEYIDGCNKAMKNGDLGTIYDDGYNSTLMGEIDSENVGWFYPETGAYYVKTEQGFEAYNAGGSLIGIITDNYTIARIFMQIETGMLVRGVPVTSTINQSTVATNTNISSALSANAASVSTGAVIGTSASLVAGQAAINAAKDATSNIQTDSMSGQQSILSSNPTGTSISLEAYLAAYQQICESLVYNAKTKKSAIKKLENIANYDLDENGTIGTVGNINGTDKGKAALLVIGSDNIATDADGNVTIKDTGNSNKSSSSSSSSNSNKSSSSSSSTGVDVPLGGSILGGKGEGSNDEFSTGDKVFGHAYLSQTDKKWKDESYRQTVGSIDKANESDESEFTIGARGCGTTALAMVANDLTGSKLTPSIVSRDAEKLGYSDETGTNWSFMNDAASLYGLKSSGLQKPTIDWVNTSLSMGQPVILSGTSDNIDSPFTSSGHYVVVYGRNGNQYQVADPRGKSSSKKYSRDTLFKDASAGWAFSKSNYTNFDKKTVAKALATNRKDLLKYGGRGDSYLSKSQKQKLLDQMITWKRNPKFKYNPKKDSPKNIATYMQNSTGMTIEPLIVQLFSSALGINLLDVGISRYGQGLKCSVLKSVSASDRQFGDICYMYTKFGPIGGILSSSAEYVGFKDATQWSRVQTVKITTNDANKYKYYRYLGPAGLGSIGSSSSSGSSKDEASEYDVNTKSAELGIGGGDPTAINSPYRGKFRISQQFKGDKFPSQVLPGSHDGFDLVGIDDKTLYATVAGVVVKAGWESETNHNKGFGQYVKIEDSANPGTFYYYGHMSEIKVKQGDVVAYGTPIGVEGTTGTSTGDHCHYCIRSTTGDSRQNGCLDIVTMSNIPNEEGLILEDNGTYGSPVATATTDASTGQTTTVVHNQTIFDKISTGLGNIVSRTLNGVATGYWDHDWTNILGDQSNTLVSTGTPTTTGGVIDTSGDYIGKYVKKFESGDEGSAMISTGDGDPNGGPSFGTYQFPSYWKTTLSSPQESNLYKFWDQYYAQSNPDVTPGNNEAFKKRWKELAKADPEGFFANEYAFCFPDYYVDAINNSKVVGSVNPDKHRAWQESFWSTSIQFGKYNNCWANGHSGMTDATDEKTAIEKFQEYKANRQPGCANRHRNTEKELLLSLVGQQPIQYSSTGQNLGNSATSTNNTTVATGGMGEGRILTKTPNIQPLLEKVGINNKANPSQDYLGYHPQIGGNGENSDSELTTSPKTVNGFAYYAQNDKRWGNEEYKQTSGTYEGDPQDMSNRGCGPTTLAMAAKGLTGKDVNPMDAARLAERLGYSDETGTNWSFMNDAPAAYGLTSTGVEHPSINFVQRSLSSGKPVILSGYSDNSNTPFTKAGHYVLAVGQKDGKVKINDPRGVQYSKTYNIKDVTDNASAAWSLNAGGIKKPAIQIRPAKKKQKQGGKGYTTADFVAACSMACAELGRNNWPYSQDTTREYVINGKSIKSRADCSGLVSAALMYLGILDSPWSSGDYANEKNSEKITSQLPMKFVKTSEFTTEDWDNLPPGTILCKGGYHVEVLMGWDGTNKNSIVYSGGSGPSEIGFKNAYGWQDGMTTVPPYTSKWGGSSYRNWPAYAYVPTDGGATYSGGTVTPAGSTSSAAATVVKGAATSIGNLFDQVSTGLGNIATRTWDGIATGNWDHDWSNILGTEETTTATSTTATNTGSTTSDYTAGEYPVEYPSGAPSFTGTDRLKNFMDIMIGGGAIQSGIQGNILPSIKLGQAAFESGFATSSLFKNTNNLYGMRSGALATGEYTTSSNGKFASYDSPSQSIADHTRLLNNSNYGSTVPNAKDYRAAAQAMVNAGYCSDSGYVSDLSNIIESNNFDYFDDPTVEAFYKGISPKSTSTTNTNQDTPIGGGNGPLDKISNSNKVLENIKDIDYKTASMSGGKGVEINNSSSTSNNSYKISNENLEKITKSILEMLTQLVDIESEGNDKLDEISYNTQSNTGRSSIVAVSGKKGTTTSRKTRSRSEVLARSLAKA